MSIESQLEELGLAPDAVQAIAQDIKENDARSLLNAVLLRGLWNNVIDETEPAQLYNRGDAIQRLLAKGVDPDDLIDVVREVQVDTIYSVAQLIDWPMEGLDLDDALEMELAVRFSGLKGAPAPIGELHSSLMSYDPAGRHGEPRSLELRHWQKMPIDVRRALAELIQMNKMSAAALLWKKHIGGDLPECRASVQALQGKVR